MTESSSLPPSLMGGGDGGADTAELLLQLTANVNQCVATLQEATTLLIEKARQLHAHEAVMADTERAGHFLAGVGMTFNRETGRHDVDALSGVDVLTARAVDRLMAERDARAAALHSPAGSRAAVIPAGSEYTVPAYVVGSRRLRISLDGLHCVPGPDAANCQYAEVGAIGATSTVIRWHDDIAPEYAIHVEVR